MPTFHTSVVRNADFWHFGVSVVRNADYWYSAFQKTEVPISDNRST